MTRLRWTHVCFWAVAPVLQQVVTREHNSFAEILTAGVGALVLASLALGAVAICRCFVAPWRAAAAVVSVGLLLAYGYSIRSYLIFAVPSIAPFLHHRVMVPCWLGASIVVGAILWRLRPSFRLDRIERILWLAAAGFTLAIAVSSGVHARTQPMPVGTPDDVGVSRASGLAERPRDIYYILLDSYPSLEVLRDEYGFVDHQFEDALHARGFDLVPNAHSNYAFTALSMASSLNMTLLGDRPSPESSITNNRLMRVLKSRGYALYHIGVMDIDPGLAEVLNYRLINPYVASTLAKTPLEALLPSTLEWLDARRRIPLEFEAVRQVARKPGPKFVYAHVLCPHPPIVFAADGRAIMPWNVARDRRSAFQGQVAFVNRQVESLLEALLAGDGNDPIIVVQGDHGSAGFFDPVGLYVPGMARDRFITAQMGILNAFHFPPGMNATMYPGMTPANSFRVVLNAALDAGMPLVADRSFFSTLTRPYEFREVTTLLRSGAMPSR